MDTTIIRHFVPICKIYNDFIKSKTNIVLYTYLSYLITFLQGFLLFWWKYLYNSHWL